jgi:hypothetical protein
MVQGPQLCSHLTTPNTKISLAATVSLMAFTVLSFTNWALEIYLF